MKIAAVFVYLLVSLCSCSGSDRPADGGILDASEDGAQADEDQIGADKGADPEPNQCNSITGWPGPLAVCSPVHPCTRLSEEMVAEGLTELTEPSLLPDCRNSEGPRLLADDNPPQSLLGIDGTPRYFCLFRPAGDELRPLVIFLHGGGMGGAENLYTATRLREKAINYQLAGPAGPAGFVLASVQGRTLHYPTSTDRDGYHHDFYFRDLAAPSANPDVANVDAIIDQLVAAGGIDANRIYLMGWSNGALFGALYGIARYQTPTEGGNRVAAIAVFSGGDPFDDIVAEEDPPCRLDPYPRSALPVFYAARNCDAGLVCNDLQQQWFTPPPGHNTSLWLQRAKDQVGLTEIETLYVGGRGWERQECADSLEECTNVYGISFVPGCPDDLAKCALVGGLMNHLRWPDGIGDGSDKDYEPRMLDFLKNHPHPN